MLLISSNNRTAGQFQCSTIIADFPVDKAASIHVLRRKIYYKAYSIRINESF